MSLVPLVAPLRPLLNWFNGRGPLTKGYQLLGGAPKPVVRWAFQLSSFQKLVTKPLALASHIDDAEFLAQIEAVDRFTDNMIAYPGRTFGQLYHRFAKGNQLAAGDFELDDRTIRLGDITVPVLVFGGSTDGIAPVPAVKAVVPLLTGSPEVRFEIVPGGHLGMLTGRAARHTTWVVMDEWITPVVDRGRGTGRRALRPRSRVPLPRSAPTARGGTARPHPGRSGSETTALAMCRRTGPDPAGLVNCD